MLGRGPHSYTSAGQAGPEFKIVEHQYMLSFIRTPLLREFYCNAAYGKLYYMMFSISLWGKRMWLRLKNTFFDWLNNRRNRFRDDISIDHQYFVLSPFQILHSSLCVIFTILVSFSWDNALFASKAKINVVWNFFEWRVPEGYPECRKNFKQRWF